MSVNPFVRMARASWKRQLQDAFRRKRCLACVHWMSEKKPEGSYDAPCAVINGYSAWDGSCGSWEPDAVLQGRKR